MTDELKRLQEKATGMPTGYLDEKHIFQDRPHNPSISGQNWKLIFAGDDKVFDKEPSGISVAATLLAALDPDAPGFDNPIPKDCVCKNCEFGRFDGRFWTCIIEGPCPGPAPYGKEYVLVCRDKVVE